MWGVWRLADRLPRVRHAELPAVGGLHHRQPPPTPADRPMAVPGRGPRTYGRSAAAGRIGAAPPVAIAAAGSAAGLMVGAGLRLWRDLRGRTSGGRRELRRRAGR